MEVVSVNVGLPRAVEWRGRRVETGIFKEPARGRVRVGRTNLEGDRQADLSVHGGPEKAVYAYPTEHYPYWRGELGGDLPWGALGENLSTRGLLEDDVCIGDRFRIGDAELVVTQPRQPCFKLALRHDRPDLVKLFQQSGRSGFYLAVAREGDLGAGDAVERLGGDERALPVSTVVRLANGEPDLAWLRVAAGHPGLPEAWRRGFATRLEKLGDRP